jgi:hypothetical protein
MKSTVLILLVLSASVTAIRVANSNIVPFWARWPEWLKLFALLAYAPWFRAVTGCCCIITSSGNIIIDLSISSLPTSMQAISLLIDTRTLLV